MNNGSFFRQRWEWLAFLGGILTLLLLGRVYLPGLDVSLFPTAPATGPALLGWGMCGGLTVAAIVEPSSFVSHLLAQVTLWPYLLLALLLILGGIWLGVWSWRRRRFYFNVLSRLHKVGERLALASSEEDLKRAVLDDLTALLGLDGAAWVEGQDDFSLITLRSGVSPDQWRALVEMVGDAEDVQILKRPAPVPSASGVLLAPVQDGGNRNWLALLRTSRPFNNVESRIVYSVLEMVRISFLNRQRFEEVKSTQGRQVQELHAVQELSRVIAESLDLQTTLRMVLDSLFDLVPYDVGEITLLDKEKNLLVCQAYIVNPSANRELNLENETYQLNEGLSGYLVRNRHSLLVDDIEKLEKVEPKNPTLRSWLHSYMGIPLTARGELIGTLEVSSVNFGQFSARDLELAELLGGQAAVAIENARLYQISQHRLGMLERLREMVRAVGHATEPDAFFKEIAHRSADVLNADIVAVLLIEEEPQRLVIRPPVLGLPISWAQNYAAPFSREMYRDELWQESFYWLIENVESDPRMDTLGLKSFVEASGARQLLLVPLETSGELVGFILVASSSVGRHFSEEDARLLAMLSSQISGMVQISRLVEQMEGRTQQLGTLVSVASAIGTSLDLNTVLDEIVEAVSDILQGQRTAIFVLDPVSNLLSLAAAKGVSKRYRELSQNLPVARGGRTHVLASNEMYICEDVAREPASSDVAPLAVEEGFRSFIDMPLRRGETPVGLLSVQFVEPHSFAEDEIHLLRILGEQAAIAIENARLYTQTDIELRWRLEALEALQRVTQEITSTVDLDYILDVVVNEALNFSGADAGAVALMSDGNVTLRAFQGYDEAALAYLRREGHYLETDSPLVQILEQHETFYVPNIESDEILESYPPSTRSLLVAPVFYEGRLAAVIVLQSREVQAFAPAVVEFIEGLATQTSIAVGNAQRYQEQMMRGELMHQRAEQMSLMLEVSRTMHSERPLEDILLDVVYAVQEGVGFDYVLISVVEGHELKRLAGAGIPLAELERMKKVRHPVSRVRQLFQDRFRLGRCYYIPAEYESAVTNGLDVFVPEGQDVERESGQWHKRDMFFVPLMNSQSDVIGLMSMDQPRNGKAPTNRLAEVVEIFAAQVALAIENSQLVDNLRQQVNTLRLFNELSRSITTKLDLPLVLNTVVQSVTNLLSYDYATISLQDRSGQWFRPMASSGYSLEILEGRSFEKGRGLVGSVIKTGMPLVMEDTQSDPRYEPGPIAIGSSVLVPLTVEGRTVGVLSADRKKQGDFSPTEVATLTALADQVSVAVENARLFDEVSRFSEEMEQRVNERTQELAEALQDLQQQKHRTEVLYQIVSELVSSLDIDRVLSQALSLLQKTLKASRSAVLLLDNTTGKLFYRAAIGHTEPIPPGGRPAPFQRNDGIVGQILNEKKTVIISDLREDERWKAVGPVAEDMRSVLGVPILGSSSEALGIIFLQSPLVNIFDEQETRLVEAAAAQLGNALNNADLYRLIREQAERLGAMLRTQQIEAAKHQAILEGIADGVMVADANGRVILFNVAAERILAVSRTEALGRFQEDILGLYGNMARDWMTQIEAWHENPESYGPDEFLAQRLEVERRVVSVHLSPVISPSQEFLGVVSVFRDITAEVEADRAKSEFVSTVSHELRTPMTSIKGYVDLLLMGSAGELGELQTNFLKTVKSNADRLTSLVNDLLDISRIETGRIELNLKPVNVGELIEQVNEMLKPKAEEKNIDLFSVVPSALPKVLGDPARLTQILTNLVGNAYKYTPSGGKVGVYAYVRDGATYVAVADTGIGISKENQKKIFDRFFRVDDPQVHEVSGTGLGLAITVSLIQLHGGELGLESELGKGSVFYFTLPLSEGEPDHDVGILPPRLAPLPETTILVVEDDPDIANLLKLTLERQRDLVVVTALTGSEALDKARELLPDLISLDLRLPDRDGFEVLEELRRDPETADIPVLIVSMIPDHETGLDMGVIDYLNKPFEEQQLIDVVDRLLENRGTVLVVDDDKDTLSMMRVALRARGLGVRTTTRGERALRLARELKPDLMLLDLKLPDIDGYQILEQLRMDAKTADIPVIVITGCLLDVKGGASELAALGAMRFLTKPFSVEDLAMEISQLINGNGEHKE